MGKPPAKTHGNMGRRERENRREGESRGTQIVQHFFQFISTEVVYFQISILDFNNLFNNRDFPPFIVFHRLVNKAENIIRG